MATTMLERIGEALRATWNPPRSLRDPSLTSLWNGSSSSTSSSTTTVTEGNALNIPGVWAAVQCIAGDVASLPLFHYRRLSNGGKERMTTSRLYRVLHDEFNPEMSDYIARETMTAHCLLWGNGYAEIVRNDLGQVVELWPIEPNRVMPDRNDAGAIIYRIQAGDGREVILPAARVLHIVGLGFNGLMGYPVITMHRQALGVGSAAERLGGDVMGRGAKYSGFFQHPRVLGAQAHKNLKEAIASDLPGTYRILEEGMTYVAGSMPLADAQFMEIRKFSVTEIARIFGIPPHKLGDLERATFSNIEEQNIDYVMWTLRRWLSRWEKECNRKLIPELEKRQQFTEHLIDGALRGNISSRYAAYQIGRTSGWLSANAILEMENRNPIPGGDEVLVQGAMVPLNRINDIVDAQVRPPPAPTPPDTPDPEDTPAEDDAARTARIVGKLVEDLRADLVSRTQPLDGLPALLTAQLDAAQARLATADDLRGWREATFGMIAGKLARREVAHLKKREADPTAAASRLEAFYRRFVGDGVTELRPWVLRLPEPEAREVAASRVLMAWADEAMVTCLAALQNGGLGDVVRRWEIDRAAGLARALTEAMDG